MAHNNSLTLQDTLTMAHPWSPCRSGLNETQSLEEWKKSLDFVIASFRLNINGWSFCNMRPPEVSVGKLVRVHFMGLGDLTDWHTPNILGESSAAWVMGTREFWELASIEYGSKRKVKCRIR
jgi:hypothetical protein